MSQTAVALHHSQNDEEKSRLGFWIYLMTDCIVFAILFATYVVLQNGTYGGPTSRELFDLPFVLIETIILLTSSFVCGVALVLAKAGKKSLALAGFGATFALGVAFLAMELSEFAHLIHQGADWQRSGFLSAFFTLVATHGLHIAIGLLWILVLAVEVMRKGLSASNIKRLTLFTMFWHFLDVIWIFIFSIVYLMGVI